MCHVDRKPMAPGPLSSLHCFSLRSRGVQDTEGGIERNSETSLESSGDSIGSWVVRFYMVFGVMRDRGRGLTKIFINIIKS